MMYIVVIVGGCTSIQVMCVEQFRPFNIGLRQKTSTMNAQDTLPKNSPKTSTVNIKCERSFQSPGPTPPHPTPGDPFLHVLFYMCLFIVPVSAALPSFFTCAFLHVLFVLAYSEPLSSPWWTRICFHLLSRAAACMRCAADSFCFCIHTTTGWCRGNCLWLHELCICIQHPDI